MDDYIKKLKKNEGRRKARAKRVFEKESKPAPKKPKQTAVDIFFDDDNIGVGRDKEADELLKKPGKDNDKPHLYTTGANIIQQADVLKLPEDQKFSYLLVVVDTGTKLMDAVPIRGDLNSTKVKDALKYIWGRPKLTKQEDFSSKKPPTGKIDTKTNIYKHGLKRILEEPVMLQTDGGPEFKKAVDTYLESRNIVHRTGMPYRSRQQAYAEARNGAIAAMLLGRQKQDEVKAKVVSRAWLKWVWKAIAANNKANGQKPIDATQIPEDPSCSGQSCDLIPVGTVVRRMEDAPRDILTGKKEVGKFRKGDLRWEVATRKVAMQIIKPGNPPLYRLTSLPTDKKKRLNMKMVAYTRAQLQVVKQKAQSKTTGQEIWNVERLVGYDKKKKQYLVKWAGFPSSENSYVKAGALIGVSNAEKKAARDAAA
eukprot:gene32501-biopygen9396